MFDMKSDVSFGRSANLTVGNNTQTTALVDMQGFEALTAIVNTNTITAFGAGITFKLQHSDSTAAASFVDCTAAEVIGAVDPVASDADDDKLMGTVGYRGNKRYVRLAAVGTASTNGVLNVIFMRSRATGSRPVAPVFALTAAT
jgi:hypothetical protein